MVMEEAMDSDMSLSNMVLSFFEEGETERWPENNDDDEVDEGSSGSSTAESRAFWQEALAKTSTAESRIRAVAEDAMEKTRAVCSCARRAAAGECRSCMLRHVAEQLRDAGYSSAICRSKWTRSLDIPAATWRWRCRPGAARRCGWWWSPASAPSSRWRAPAPSTARWSPRSRRRSSAAPTGCGPWSRPCAPPPSSASRRTTCTWDHGGSTSTCSPSGLARPRSATRPRRRRRLARSRPGRCRRRSSPSSGRPCSASTSAGPPQWSLRDDA